MKITVLDKHEGLDILVESVSVLGRSTLEYTLKAKQGEHVRYEEKLGLLSSPKFEKKLEEFLAKITDLYGKDSDSEDISDSADDEEEQGEEITDEAEDEVELPDEEEEEEE